MSSLCALALLASFPAAANAAPVVYCGIVRANTVTSGAGSGARVFEFTTSTGPGGPEQRFSVPDSIALPTVGTYICGQFEQGAPSMSLVTLLRSGDPGYVAQLGVVPATTVTALPSTAVVQPAVQPVAVAQPDAGISVQLLVSLLLIGLAALAAIGMLISRSRRTSAAH